jgi:hypothetical protein
LATSVALSNGDSHVGGVQGQRVVDTVAEEADRSPLAAQRGDQPRLLLGGDAGEDGVVLRDVNELVVVEGLELCAGRRALGRQTQVGADLFGDPRIVAGGDLQLDAERGQLGQGLARRGFGFVGEHQEAGQLEIAFVGRGDSGQLGRGFDGHGHHPAPGGEQGRKGRLGVFRGRRRRLAAGQHLFGRALDHEHAFPVFVNQNRCRAALVVERQGRDPLHGGADQLLCLPGLPERGVERIGADTARFRVDIGGQQPQSPDGLGVRTGLVDGVHQADSALREGAGLVGDQDVDVAQIFDAHQPLHEHLRLGQLPRSRRQAGADHGGQQLRRDADRDRQREQHRIDDRLGQEQIADQDDHHQRDRDLQQ